MGSVVKQNPLYLDNFTRHSYSMWNESRQYGLYDIPKFLPKFKTKPRLSADFGRHFLCCATMSGHVWSESKWMLVLI